MPTRIDHVIIAAPDLDRLEETFQQLGFSIVGGGTHPHLGTRNRIIILGDGYIELLATADAERVSPVLRERIALGSGWVGFALQSDDIASEARAMREHGADVHGPSAGRLVAPDGTARSWQVVTIGADDLWAAALPLPFLIQHDSSGERHQRELAGADQVTPHANGADRIAGVTLRAADLDGLRKRFELAYGLEPAPVTSPDADEQSAVLYPLARDSEWVRLVQPKASGSLTLAPHTEAVMRVTVHVQDISAVERAVWLAGRPAQRLDYAIRVALPDMTAHIDFVATA